MLPSTGALVVSFPDKSIKLILPAGKYKMLTSICTPVRKINEYGIHYFTRPPRHLFTNLVSDTANYDIRTRTFMQTENSVITRAFKLRPTDYD